MIRSELDALPIQELGPAPYRSTLARKAHLCGHDGHSAILLGVARLLARKRPARGRVVLMFQPAEEDGSGAAAVIADRRYAEIRPDFAFSLHNMPGIPLGEASLSEGPVNCASRGIRLRLEGSTAHASQPETGRSPMRAVASLMPALEALGPPGPMGPQFTMATVTHAAMGAPAFGVAPGEAEIWATLRTLLDSGMEALCAKAETLALSTAAESGLRCTIDYADVFAACANDPEATAFLRRGAERAGAPHRPMPAAHRASEDFGRFGADARSAMLFLGAGTDCPDLHTPTYDFPDALLGPGIRLFAETVAACLGEN